MCWSLAWWLPLCPPLHGGFLFLRCPPRWTGPLILPEHPQSAGQTVRTTQSHEPAAEKNKRTIIKNNYTNCVHSNRPLSLSDLQKALQSSGVHEGLVFSGGVVDLAEGDALRLIPTAVRQLTERASHGDWILRSSWLSHLGKSYKYAPGLFLYTHKHSQHQNILEFEVHGFRLLWNNVFTCRNSRTCFCQTANIWDTGFTGPWSLSSEGSVHMFYSLYHNHNADMQTVKRVVLDFSRFSSGPGGGRKQGSEGCVC